MYTCVAFSSAPIFNVIIFIASSLVEYLLPNTVSFGSRGLITTGAIMVVLGVLYQRMERTLVTMHGIIPRRLRTPSGKMSRKWACIENGWE